MENKTVDQVLKDLNIQVKWVLIIGAVALILMPIAATQLNFLLDFTRTGQIGDTLGGTTTPVIGAVSALLIYFSFRAQIEANLIIQNQIDDQKTEETSKKNFEHQMERYKHLREYIDGFKHKIHESSAYPTVYLGDEIFTEKYGAEAITQFLRCDNVNSRNLSEFRTIISFFNLILNDIIPEKANTNSKFIFNLIEIQFYRKIWDLNEDIILSVLDNPSGVPDDIILIIEKIREIHVELIKYKKIWPD